MMENDDLKIRIAMCKLCIKTLEENCKDDPRQPDALNHYKNQLVMLEGKLSKVLEMTFDSMLPKPPDIVIGLKPATLSERIPKFGS